MRNLCGEGGPKNKTAAEAGTSHRGLADDTPEPYATDPAAASVTWAKVSRLAERMRREKSPAARIGWACASILSLDEDHRAELVRVLIAPLYPETAR